MIKKSFYSYITFFISVKVDKLNLSMVFHIIQLKIYFKFAKYFIHLLSYYNMLYYSTIIPLFGAKQELRWLNKNKVENLNS